MIFQENCSIYKLTEPDWIHSTIFPIVLTRILPKVDKSRKHIVDNLDICYNRKMKPENKGDNILKRAI